MNNMSEYIKSSELCRRCKYSTKGAICEPISRCDGCKQDDGGACRCNSVKTGEPCPYFAHPFGVWISVKEALPKTDGQYLCSYGFVHDGELSDMRFIDSLDYYACDPAPHWQHASNGLFVTHWMPLPEPPEERHDL